MRTPRIAALLALLAPALGGCSLDETVKPVGSDSPLGDVPGLPIDDRLSVDRLAGKVDVVRDTWGRPHIYATSVADAMRVEGYLVARDRAIELDFYRRVSEGRLAEILSQADPSTIGVDISFRHIGLGRVAQKEWEATPPGEARDALEAYADGVTQAFAKYRSGELKLPRGVFGVTADILTDWSPVDSLAIGRLQTYLLSYDADGDIGNASFFEAARGTFTSLSADFAIASRAGLERDLFRFAPADSATTTTGYPVSTKSHGGPAPRPAPRKADPGAVARRAALATTAGYREAMGGMRAQFTRAGFGSNNWAIAPSRSATGHAMVASDPHLSLSAPSVFWPVSISVKVPAGSDARDLVMAGLAFPGIPAIILGHNEHIGWGATVAGYDVSDAYVEELTDDGKGVKFAGQVVPIEIVHEEIKLQKGAPIQYDVQVVPHHGPIVPDIQGATVVPADPKKGAISIRWTGLEPTAEFSAVLAMLRAKDVDEARAALADFQVGAQNWMLGDTSGNILWTSHARVPIRDPRAFAWDAQSYAGTIPCLTLPGDGSAEWKGMLGDDLVPWAKNPAAGFLSTANNDPIGDTVDNDPTNDTLPDGSPMFLACRFDIGFREGKIQERLTSHADPFAPEDLSAIQGDEQSSMGKALAPSLLDAIARGQEEQASPGAHPDLGAVVGDAAWDAKKIKAVRDLVDAWGKAGYHASSGVSADDDSPLPASGESAAEVSASQATLLFNAWMVRLLGRTLGDEMDKMGVRLGGEDAAKALLHLVNADPATLATYDAKTGDSALWDDLGTPSVVESRHERMLRALLDAFADLPADLGTWRWGAYHRLRFTSLVSAWGALSIPPEGDATFPHGFPRHGDRFSIDASDFGFAHLGSPLDFSYGAGPTQRFVVDLDPAGPKAVNALPGGVVWDPTSTHFSDEAELWRRNQTHAVPFLLPDVVAAKENRTLFSPR
jgi:penicillin amidase